MEIGNLDRAHIPSIRDAANLRGKRIVLRLDLNVPLTPQGEVADDFRIRKVLPTLALLGERGALVRAVSHIDGAGGSLRAVADYMVRHLGVALTFVPEMAHPQAALVLERQSPREIVLFENIRREPGEERNDPAFAERLAGLGDVYVNDAFSVSHRPHASIVGVPKLLPSYTGLQFTDEIEHLSQAFDPPRPFIFIIGGIKFSTKLPLVRKFLDIADAVFVGGALANDIFRARGLSVGKSVVSEEALDLSGIVNHPKLLTPSDVRVRPADDPREEAAHLARPENVSADEIIMDAGPATLEALRESIGSAAFIVWNGPLGDYEHDFEEGTEALAALIAAALGRSVVGGGDTIAAISRLKLEAKFTFVSTGGGAMLDFLADSMLPGLEALMARV
ncbi:MAG: phosphoglycerate kinase [bacterium]|nr:phosphoglycerate kinase [bacterium]MDZ4284564.1 phosphoglycerate kinase [Patescibacteria group bacterium]